MAIGSWSTDNPARLVGYGGAALAAALLASLVVQAPPVMAELGLAFLAFLLLVALWPETGLLLAVGLVYLNVPVIVFKYYGVSQFVATGVPLVLLLPALANHIARRRPFVIDYTFLLMLAFLAAILLSSFAAVDKDLSSEWIWVYLSEGLALYLLIVNVVRTTGTLHRLVAVLVFAGALLGALSIYQEVTGSYEQTFGEFAQRNFDRETEDASTWDAYQSPYERNLVRLVHRAMGPLGDPNRYAQIMLVLLPLAWWQTRHVRRQPWKAAAAACTVLILGGVLLTYSRGAFIAIALLLPLALAMRFLRWRDLLWIGGGVVIVGLAVAPGYLKRMDTLRGIEGLYSPGAGLEPDAVQRGRATEMLAAAGVFFDHPLVGVGPGQYSAIYSVDYMNRGDFMRRIKVERRAHSLYLELAAESGMVGLAIFLSIAGLLVVRLANAARRLRRAQGVLLKTAAARADLALAFVMALAGYFASALFLHFSYQRYYWLLVALAGAAVHVLQRGDRAPTKT
jgi:hypothetical protein